MGIVVEVVGRNGSIIRSQSFQSNTVSIGRAYDCDVILSDLHVDALHLIASLDEVSRGLLCKDGNSLNGSWLLEPSRFEGLHKNKRQLHGSSPVFSGQALLLGRTYIRIYSSEHWVPPAQPLSAWEDFGLLIGRYWVAAMLVVCVFALEVWDAYLNAPLDKKVFQYAISGLYPIVAAAVYAFVWSIVGKVTKHDGKFLTHMSVGLLSVFVLILVKLFLPNVLYALGAGGWERVAHKLSVVLVTYVCLSVTLIFASHLKSVSRHLLAAFLPLMFLSPFIVDVLTRPDFNGQPGYDRSLAAPVWSAQSTVDIEQFVEVAQKMYADEGPGSD